MRGALLVAGTGSNVGKTLLVAGICRWLARQGVRVAPFKAQNMALNSAVTVDGAEISRAQAVQADAAGVPAEAAMNPVLLKPSGERTSHVVVLGRPLAHVEAADYPRLAGRLRAVVHDSLADLRRRFDVVVCEGAGSPAEFNLRDWDIVNMGLALPARLPVVVVGDVDRGGVFASFLGTVALLSQADQELVAGFVVNKFRGDPDLLRPGLRMIEQVTGRRVFGVLPYRDGLLLDLEDALDDEYARLPAAPPVGRDVLRVSVVALPSMSNATDVDPLAHEPGVLVRLATTPAALADADLVVLPGTRATCADLSWLRERGLAAELVARARRGLPVLGVCGGFQMLGTEVVDGVESGQARVPGLGLLPVTTRFSPDKVLRRPSLSDPDAPASAYEIHHGVCTVHAGEPFPGGCRVDAVWGTSWHGLLEDDALRRDYLRQVASLAGRDFTPAPDTSFAAVRAARLDMLGDLVEEFLDTAALTDLVERGAPAGLPFVPPGPPAIPSG